MKTKFDPRHQQRIKIVQFLFGWQFTDTNQSPNAKASKVIKKVKKIDLIISKHAPSWPIDQIATMDLAILRLAIFELLFEKKEPEKVVIDEAIEIAKEYGNESSSSFINGVLGSVLQTRIMGELKNDRQ